MSNPDNVIWGYDVIKLILTRLHIWNLPYGDILNKLKKIVLYPCYYYCNYDIFAFSAQFVPPYNKVPL